MKSGGSTGSHMPRRNPHPQAIHVTSRHHRPHTHCAPHPRPHHVRCPLRRTTVVRTASHTSVSAALSSVHPSSCAAASPHLPPCTATQSVRPQPQPLSFPTCGGVLLVCLTSAVHRRSSLITSPARPARTNPTPPTLPTHLLSTHPLSAPHPLCHIAPRSTCVHPCDAHTLMAQHPHPTAAPRVPHPRCELETCRARVSARVECVC